MPVPVARHALMTPAPPAYRGACVSRLLPDAVTAVTGGRPAVLDLPADIRAIIVLVVDGLGRHLLDRHADLAPFLASRDRTTADAPFPTTTTTSLTSIGTGLSPGQHGIVGYSLALEDDDRPLIALTWTWVRQDLDLDARLDVVPEDFQPRPTVFEQARRRGVRAVTVLRPEFAASGLTRVGLRGGEVVPAAGLADTLRAAVEATDAPGPVVVYAHHGDLDATGHLTGPGSDRWCEQLVRLDEALQRTTAVLPPDVGMVVTADHGMVAIPSDGYVELADAPQLLDGVRVLTGDGRARQLHTRPGARDHVAGTWREAFPDRAHVRTRDEAIDAGWFGEVAAEHRRRIGDVVVVARTPDVAWVHRDADPFGGRLLGMHGALTDEEREVPVVPLTGGDA